MRNFIICIASIILISSFTVFQTDINEMQRMQELVYETANDISNTAALQLVEENESLPYAVTFSQMNDVFTEHNFSNGYIEFDTRVAQEKLMKAAKVYLGLTENGASGFRSSKKGLPGEIHIYTYYFNSPDKVMSILGPVETSGSVYYSADGSVPVLLGERWEKGDAVTAHIPMITERNSQSMNTKVLNHPCVITIIDCGKPYIRLKMLKDTVEQSNGTPKVKICKIGLYEYSDF